MATRELLLLGLIVGVVGCVPVPEFDRALHSTDSEHIQDLRALMTRHGVAHRDTERGGINYRSADEAQVAELRKKLDKSTAVKYPEAEARTYLVKLLDETKQDYIVKEKADGTWIMWFPKSESEANELTMKVSQYLFALHVSRTSQDCPSPKAAAPSNSTFETDARQDRPRAAQCER